MKVLISVSKGDTVFAKLETDGKTMEVTGKGIRSNSTPLEGKSSKQVEYLLRIVEPLSLSHPNITVKGRTFTATNKEIRKGKSVKALKTQALNKILREVLNEM